MILKILFVLCFVCNGVWTLQCLDQNNNPVDWYVVYKMPLEPNPNALIAEGAAYVYMTNNDKEWILSNVSINDSNSIIGKTLGPLFASNADNLYILYNDENPDGSINFKKGHTKGTVLADKDGGIWMVHSVPRFPDLSNAEYYFTHNGFHYGQSFLCISLDLKNMDAVGSLLEYNLPNIYSLNIPTSLQPLVPNLVNVAHGTTAKTAPWYHQAMLKSKSGLIFMAFAKGPKFAKELYADWVAPTLNVNLLVETWPNGPGRLPSECTSQFKVNNVESVNIKAANFTFKTTTDHSKWAVVPKDCDAKWICVGDINRAISQRRRGGGTVCFSSGSVAGSYEESIAAIEAC